MKNKLGIIPLAAITAMLMVTGCGTIGDTLLSALKEAAVEEIKTATSQAVEQAVNEIESGVQQAIIQEVTDAAASQ